MEYVTLSSSFPQVSPLCLGTWQFGDFSMWSKQTQDNMNSIVKNAFDCGINFFDTAEAYGGGDSEKSLGEALRASGKKREDYVIADKVDRPHLGYDDVIKACEKSLKLLGTDYIDLYQIHWPNPEFPIDKTMEALMHLQKQNKIRAFGVSNFGVLDTQDAVKTGAPIVTNQLPYNLLTRAIEYEIMDVCKKNDIKILAYSPLAQGLLTGKYKTLEDALKNPGLSRTRLFKKGRSEQSTHQEDGCEEEMFDCISTLLKTTEKYNEKADEQISPSQLALVWCLSRPNISGCIVGASKESQIQDSVKCMKIKNSIDKDLLDTLTHSSEPVKKKLGKNPDLWEAESRYR